MSSRDVGMWSCEPDPLPNVMLVIRSGQSGQVFIPAAKILAASNKLQQFNSQE